MEWVVGIKHSNCRQVFGTIRRALFRYSRNKIVSGLLSERRRATKDFVYDDEFKILLWSLIPLTLNFKSKTMKIGGQNGIQKKKNATQPNINSLLVMIELCVMSLVYLAQKNTIHFACVVTVSCW